MTSCVIRGGAQGKARLRVIAAALRPSTLGLLARAGLAPGMTCLDLGCGGGEVTLELARLVGPHGTAIGIDMDDAKLLCWPESPSARSPCPCRSRILAAERVVHRGGSLRGTPSS